jgi:hypothetical protein
VSLFGSKIAEQMIDCGETFGNELTMFSIRDRQGLRGMDVIEGQAACFDRKCGIAAADTCDTRQAADTADQYPTPLQLHAVASVNQPR